MRGLQFADVSEALPTFALALMQNLPEDDQRQLADRVLLLQGANMSDDTKLLVLGLELMNVVGPETPNAAVTAYKKAERAAEAPEPT